MRGEGAARCGEACVMRMKKIVILGLTLAAVWACAAGCADGDEAPAQERGELSAARTQEESRPLTEEDIREVARRMLKTVSARMETMGIHLDASDEAVAELAKEGFDPKYGARPLRRAIQSKVEDAVAEKMLDGTLKAGDTAKLTVENNRLCVSK